MPGVRVRDDFDNASRIESREPVDLQGRKKGVVESVGRHRRIRQQRDLGANARVDEEVVAGHFADSFDYLANVGLAKVRHYLIAIILSH